MNGGDGPAAGPRRTGRPGNRGAVDGLVTTHPLFDALPAVYQVEGANFTRRFLAGFDDVLSPAQSVLDNLEAYIDPDVAPHDFLRWMAGWMGVQLVEVWPEERQREQVARAIALHPLRGSVRGLRENVALYAGVPPERVEVVDSGGVAWSPDLDGPIPGSATPSVTVRILTDDATQVDMDRVKAIVAAAKPAHVRHSVEVATE